MRKRYKIAILALTAAVATTSVVSVVSCGKKSNPLDTDWAGKTVCYELPTDGSTPDQHTGIENIGYMVYRLQNQPSYYSEMHGSVSTMIEQTVETYKQYNDGVMIASDISISSMVKTAQQTCFVGDYVLWRGAATGAADWDGLNTKWETNDPTKITVEDYKANYGLPGTDFSVYILNEDTVLSASDVTVNADGTYTQTFELNPETDAAPYYYRQKMLTTGGLDEWPVFSSIRVTYTFDSTWQILSSVIDESYSAKMIVSVGCNAHYVTTYEYETPKAESSDYEDYYSNYADKPVSELPSGGEITAAGCLTQAFGEVLTGPAVFNVSLTLNGTPVDGVVYVDINNMDIRAAFGNLRVWYAGEEVYLALGDLKAKVSVEEFASLLGEMMPEGSSDFSEAIDVNALLEQLGNGTFVVGESQATLDTQLSLFGMDLPVCFTFCLGDSITLGSVRSDLSFGDFSLGICVTPGTQVPEAFPAADEARFIPLMPYVKTLVGLFTNDVLAADLSYSDGDLSLSGEICVNLKEFAAAGSVSVVYGTVSKQIDFSFDGETVYLNLDGIKLRANAEEAVTLIGKYVDLPDMQGTADIDAVISAVLSLDTDSLVQMSETGNTLQIAVKGTELLKAFGVEFELGDVSLNVTESGLTASALGAEISVTAGEAFAADTEGYTDIVRYAGYLIDLFSNENLKADISFANGDLALSGNIDLNLKNLLVKGEFVVSYKGVQKDVKVIYGENVLYLELEGLKVKANIEEALGLVKEFVAIPETDGNAEELILKVLSLNFGEVISVSEDGTALSVVLKGTELLKALGVEFELGDVALNVTESGLTASAYGATVAVTAGEAFTADTEGYTDIVKYAGYLIDLFSNENLKAELSFANGDLALSGNIDLNLKNLLVKGEFVVSYKGVQKDVKVIYGENVLYLELEGLKVKASVEEALGLVKEFVAIPETDGNAEELILKVLSLNFGEVIAISEDGTSLSVIVKGTELLKALGVEFELGDVALNVTESGLTASALGAEISVTAGEEFTADTEGYTDIVKYAGYLIDLFSNENLKADISFASGDLALDGTVALNLKNLLVKGEFVVSYKGVQKDVKVIYGENVLYLELEGLKVKANIEEALGLVKEFVAIPETDGNAEEFILKVLSLNFGEVISVSEDGTALSVVLKGTELLKALGVEFELGDVMLNVTESGLTASALGAEISVTAGEAFTADTEGYTDIVKYAGYLIDLFSNENLKAELSFANGDLALDGTVALNLNDLLVKGEFVVSYKGIEKDVKVIYGENVLYLELEGLKVKANIEEALGLVKEFVAIPETDGNAEELILKVLSLNFGEVIGISEDGTSLSVLVKGTELLKALGVEFELGDVSLNVTESGLTASAYGAEISVMAGEAFTADTEGYTDIVKYAGYLIDLFSNENLKAELSFANGDLALDGTVALNLKDLLVKGEFVVSYKGVQKDVKVIYGENVLYLELEGLKVKANAEEALGLVKEFVAIPETDGNAEDILLKVLSLNFGEVISVSEDGTSLSVIVKGTELLKALGVEFELGDVMLNVTESGLTASALGAEISVTAGEAFTTDTEGYTDIVKYAGYLIDLFSNENLKADISFASGDLALDGTVALNLKDLLVKGEFVLSYKGVQKDVKVIYGENVLYLELEGLKVKASVEEALGLVKEFVAIPETDGNTEELILKVLSLNFGEVINISEDGTSLSVIVKGTELLKALGVEFELGDVALNVTESGLTASAYGAEISVTAGEAFTADTEGYTDIVRYAGYLIDLFSNENLKAELSFANGDLALDGTVALNLKDLLVKGEFVVSYKGIEKDVKIVYGENVLYLELEGLKVKANIEEALGLVKEFVAIPETDGNAEDILLKVLSLNFGEVIAISEDGTALSVVLKGTELLKALGVEFELGDVALNVTESGLTASAYGATVAVTAGEAFTADTEGYTDIVRYAGYLIELFTNENLKADISFASGDIAVSGNIDLNLKNLLVKGEFVVSYKGIEKDVKIVYGENVLYLELEGLKVKANIEEALGLVKEFVAIPETDGSAEDILLKVLSLNFGEVISVSEDGTALSVVLKGTELLKALGVEFELGDVTLNVTESGLTAFALGAEISVTASEAFTADTEGYTDIVRYAGYLIDLFSNENLKADISFASGDLALSGNIDLNLKDLLVKGEFVVSYKGIEKDVKVIYGENVLYLELEGLKVKASVEEALGLVKEFVAIPETDGNAEELILKVLSLNFGEVINISEDGTSLSVVLKGTELLKAFGVEFELGDVMLNVTESGLTASAYGAEISVMAGEAFTADTEGYADAIGTIEAILSIVKQEGVSLGGAVDLTVGTTQVTLILNKAAISWKDGFRLYAEMTVYVAGTQHDILLQTDGTSVQIAYGAVGATLSKEELPTLEEAIVTLYNRIKAVVDEAVVAAESPLPAIASWEDLLALLGLGEQLSGIMDTAGAPIGDTVAELLGQIQLCAPTQPNGIFVIRMGAMTAELLQNPADEKLVFQIDYAGEGFAVSAEVHAEALTGAFPAIPESVHLLTADDFAVLCDYVGAAAESLLLDEITVSLDGTVNSTAEEYAPFGGVKYALGAQIEYRSGGTFPVALDLDGKKITVSPDVYAHIGLDMVASLAGDQSLYLDFYLLDANPDGSTDGILDLYLSVSRFAESAAEYAPLNVYLPADDLMTVLSSVLAMSGIRSDLLEQTIVSEWLDVETTEELRALGESLKGTLGLDELLGALGVSAMSETDAFVVSDLIRDFTVTDEAVSLTLESDTVYGASMPDDIFLSLTKGAVASADGATRGYLSSFRLDNVYTDATATEKLSLALALVPSCAAGGVSIGSYYNFTGVGQLLKTLAKSATHPAGDGYAVNDYFFLNGTVDLNALSLLKVTVNIEGIAVYLDEDFNVAVDMRISYPGVQELNQVLINGDSSVDLSIRGGMVYMKRVQTSEYYWNTLISMKEREIEPVTLYRVMPLDRFLDDILNQLVFLFNFGDLIADQIAGSGDPAPAESVAEDYGAMIASYLTSYSYAAGTSPAWTVVLNGASLTDDVMGDIGITLSTSADGILSGLTATTSVYSVMDITAQLTYRNPRGQMQEGVTDPTVNIGEYLEREMSKGLAQADWENTLYLEAAPKSANFIAVGELLNTQTVLCDTATNAIYTQLSYPDLSAYPELTGYRLGWKQADILPADGNIYANYVANVYTVTILSEREAEGMTFDGALGMWKAELPYTYGTKLELPAGLFADKAMQTVSYTDADGKAYSFVENILSDLTLTAHWDYIEYIVQFVADGEIVGTQTAHYGDAIEYPEIPEKTGYDIVGWNTSVLTAEGDMLIEAVYAAKTFTVTLYSEFELDGFAACEGGYTLALSYTYGETLALPVGVEREHHFLNVYEDAEGKTYTVVENILSDLTLTARWEELGYKVDFVADGVTVATHNYYEGDSLNPPAVPGKAGYVGSWDIPEGYTVSGDDTVYAVYTPATYTVTVYSDLAADGFAATGDGRHSYSFDYTYGSAAVVLDPSLKVPCYDFGGYTLADGTPVSQVENIVSDLAVYVVWVDNTVTVRLSSDAEFNGYEGYNAADGYYLTVKFNDVYDLTQSLTAVGYKQFGWWTEANGSWERVTSVAGLDGAAVWAAWIADDLNVTVTEASTSLGSWGGTWTIGGTYQGGKPYGDHSKEIFSSVGVSRSDGVYYRASKDGVSAGDTLSSGDLVGVSGGTFYKSGMTSAKGSLWKYGGADAHITYSYGDLSVTVDSATVFRKK